MIIGKDFTDGEQVADFNLDVSTFLKTHTFLQSITGHGKTNLTLNVVDGLINERPDIQFAFLDDLEEFTFIPKKYKNIILISKQKTPDIFTTGHAV